MTDAHVKNQQQHDARISERVEWQAPAEEVPAYGVVRLTTFSDPYFVAEKPSSTDGLFYVNDGVPVSASAYASSLVWVRPQPVMFNPSDTPSVGDTCGPVESQWYMGSDGTGWKVFIGRNGNNIAWVVKEGTGSSGGGIFARGSCASADCDAGTLSVEILKLSFCGDPPEAYGGTVTAVDADGIMAGHTSAELVGASIRMGYYYDIDDCSDTQWEIWSIVGIDQCGEVA